MTDEEIEKALSEQDQLELNSFRKDVRDPEKAEMIEFIGERKETAGRLQLFQHLGQQPGVVFKTYGFLDDEAVRLAKKHLSDLLGEDADE